MKSSESYPSGRAHVLACARRDIGTLKIKEPSGNNGASSNKDKIFANARRIKTRMKCQKQLQDLA
eukprot:6847538-Prorocentrum_lima.AAC.1